MDAGIAAVLGALAGAAATIGTSLVTSHAGRSQARLSARAEHLRQRRQPRESVYRDFLASATDLRDQLRSVSGGALDQPALLDTDEFDDAYAAEVNRLNGEIRARWLDVSLSGPTEVAARAGEIEAASARVALAVVWLSTHDDDHWATDHVCSAFMAHTRTLFRAIPEMIELAREALDDDGTAAVTARLGSGHGS
ncbi:hypothetical protein ACWD6P_00240 [Streptomyces sp. NPDC002446]